MDLIANLTNGILVGIGFVVVFQLGRIGRVLKEIRDAQPNRENATDN